MILVPVDFSANALSAARYAYQLGISLELPVRLIYVQNDWKSEKDSPTTASGETAEHYLSRLQGSHEQWTKEFGNSSASEVYFDVVSGQPEKMITDLSNAPDIFMIVMGSTGAAVKPKLFGSVAVYVAQNADCPVLLIPHQYQFQAVKKVIFACNFYSTDIGQMEKVASFAQLFKADVELLFVKKWNFGDDREFDILCGQISQHFKNYLPEASIRGTVITGENIAQEINEYAKYNRADLVAIIAKKRSVVKDTYLHPTTSELAMDPSLPILVIHT